MTETLLDREWVTMSTQKYLTTIQLAERLNTNPQAIRASRNTGLLFGLPSPLFVKFGTAKILYKLKDIEAYEEQGNVQRITV